MLRSYRNFSKVFNWKRRRGVREWTGVDLESRIVQTRLFFKLKSSRGKKRQGRNKNVVYVRRKFREKREKEEERNKRKKRKNWNEIVSSGRLCEFIPFSTFLPYQFSLSSLATFTVDIGWMETTETYAKGRKGRKSERRKSSSFCLFQAFQTQVLRRPLFCVRAIEFQSEAVTYEDDYAIVQWEWKKQGDVECFGNKQIVDSILLSGSLRNFVRDANKLNHLGESY